jgi:hypothetical protein
VLARQRSAVALCAHAYRMDHPNKDTQYYQKVVDLQESSKTGKKPTKISLAVTIMPDGRSLAPLLSKTVSKNERNSL